MFQNINGVYLSCEHEVVTHIPKGIYNLKYNRREYKAEATKVGECFKVPSKIYNLDSNFVERVKHTFLRRNTNMGVILNGYRGSGKTMMAKVISNDLQLPVFVINENLGGDYVQEFCRSLEQDCILFIDEYEKIFGNNSELLSLMDGSLHLNCKILFLLTSNSLDVNENLFNRPSRVFYIKQFDGLNEDEVKVILDDYLKKPKIVEEVRKYIFRFEEVTIDNILIFLDEINYSDLSIDIIAKNLNITFKKTKAGFGLGR